MRELNNITIQTWQSWLLVVDCGWRIDWAIADCEMCFILKDSDSIDLSGSLGIDIHGVHQDYRWHMPEISREWRRQIRIWKFYGAWGLGSPVVRRLEMRLVLDKTHNIIISRAGLSFAMMAYYYNIQYVCTTSIVSLAPLITAALVTRAS